MVEREHLQRELLPENLEQQVRMPMKQALVARRGRTKHFQEGGGRGRARRHYTLPPIAEKALCRLPKPGPHELQ